MIENMLKFKGENDFERISDEFRIDIVDIGPKLASRMLQFNENNRTLKRRKIGEYYRDMINERWHTNTGESIKFDTTGNLRDGQNRLYAVIKANVTLPFLVVRGMCPSSFMVLDTGARRSALDVLHIDGHDNCSALAGASRKFKLYSKSGGKNLSGSFYVPSNEDILDFVNNNPQIEESVKFAKKHCNKFGKKYIGYSTLAFLHFVFSKKSRQSASLFFEALEAGYNVNSYSGSILARCIPEQLTTLATLRNRLLEQGTEKGFFKDVFCITIIMKCWNWFRVGKPMSTLRLGKKEMTSFPVIK